MIFGQVPAVTIVNEGGGFSWVALLTGVLPALVALLVVWIGGRQQQARQRDDAKAGATRWSEEQAFERERFALQERRKLYAEFLDQADRLSYLTTHALAHHGPQPPLCEHEEEDAIQEWMAGDDKLNRLLIEVALIGSTTFYEIAEDLQTCYRHLDVIYPAAKGVAAWFDGTDEHPPVSSMVRDLERDLTFIARDDLGLPSPGKGSDLPPPGTPPAAQT